MKIAVAQMKCVLGDVPANCRTLASLVERAGGHGCDVIVFPEICDTGYEMSVIREQASAWPGLPFDTAQSAAAKHGVHVICGLSEREGQSIYNSAAVFSPKGDLLAKYRKAHLFTPSPVNEDRCFTAGSSLEVVNIGGLKWGLMICYDLRFPELARALAVQGAEVLALCTAWPFPRVAHLQTLVQARAIENQTYVVSANRVGTDGPVTFCGSSCIIDPYGVIVASAAVDREELLIGEINRETLVWVRGRMPVFAGRRADLYGDLKAGAPVDRNEAS